MFCTKNALCFGDVDQENHFQLVLSTKRHMLHDCKPKRLTFGSEALTRLPTCISVPDGALHSHSLSCHGGGSAHKRKI